MNHCGAHAVSTGVSEIDKQYMSRIVILGDKKRSSDSVQEQIYKYETQSVVTTELYI